MGQNLSRIMRKKVGGFNRVFICIMDDSLRNRGAPTLSLPLAGPAKITTASEVATIQYYAWNNKPEKNQLSLTIYAI